MLCGMQLNNLVGALKVMPFAPGKEFEIVSFSFDPNEGPDLARTAKESHVRDYGNLNAAEGWHFLTGSAEEIEKLTASIGFHYTFDQRNEQWAHASTLLVVTPEGRISQYFNGIDYDPTALKYSLIDASKGKIGTILDRVLLFCYQFDAHSGRYSLAIMRLMRVLGVAAVFGLVTFWVTNRNR
jgi:protein SCO1/2